MATRTLAQLKAVRDRKQSDLITYGSTGDRRNDSPFLADYNYAESAYQNALKASMVKPKPVAAVAPKPASAPAPVVPMLERMPIGVPAPALTVPSVFGAAQAPVPGAQVGSPATIANPPPVPTFDDAERRVEATLNPVGSQFGVTSQVGGMSQLLDIAKRKRGLGSTLLTGERGLPSLGSIGTSMLLGG